MLGFKAIKKSLFINIEIMKKLNLSEMEGVSGGISFGCAMSWVGLGLGFGGIIAAGFVTGGAAVAAAGWALGGYIASIVDVVVNCS